MTFRIGHGYDVHAFTEGDHIILGGVQIPHNRAFKAHSDGDVLIHALCDALLGAVGLGDIGRHFPDTDPQWRGADSRVFLRHVAGLLSERGWRVGNIDCTVVAQAPRLGAHVASMAANLADDLGVVPGAVNVKATTTERLGFAGREEGIAAHAVALVESV